MRVGLIDVDSHNFPNLCLMKLSEYHTRRGDRVEWWDPAKQYDLVYKSRVFTDTYSKDTIQVNNADKVIQGGTGYGPGENLPHEIEHIRPDYFLYPRFLGTAYGFLSRGCPRNCGFCIVSGKEGRRSVRVADLSEFWNGEEEIKLMDPNLLACPDHERLIEQLIESRALVDFNVIICDPEDEYSPLVKRLGGQVIRLSPSSTDYVNPLDINLNYSEEENPLALKSDFVLSFCELIMGSKTGLEAIEKTVIDRAVQMIYQPYFADPRPGNMPILGDLMNALLSQHIPEADRVAQALDLYVNGSLNFFNHRTTVDISNRLVCFDIKGLGKNLKKPGMLIVQDAVWNTVTINRAIGRSTWYFVDEFHLLLKEEQTAAYSVEIWKRFRKWGGIPTGATQNPKDLLSSPEIENILENSDFIYMLNQAAGDRKILAERLNISSEQLAYVTNSEPGHGLLFFNNVILPFADDFPKDTELYKLLTTKPSEVAHETVDDEKEDQNG